MMRSASVSLLFASLTIAASLSAPLAAQTATHRAAPAHRSATAAKPASTAAAATASRAADNPPGVPPVASAPKQLYALRYVDIVVGTGPLAAPQKFYTVKYTGWLTDGTKFDSSYDHAGQEPITFPYGAHRVIPGWDTGFTGMRVGGKRRLYIPYQLAYGESGREGAIPPRADLIFDIELVVSISENPPAPPAPPAGAAPAGTKPATPPPAGSSDTKEAPATAAPQPHASTSTTPTDDKTDKTGPIRPAIPAPKN